MMYSRYYSFNNAPVDFITPKFGHHVGKRVRITVMEGEDVSEYEEVTSDKAWMWAMGVRAARVKTLDGQWQQGI